MFSEKHPVEIKCQCHGDNIVIKAEKIAADLSDFKSY